MKKRIVLMLAGLLLCGALAGCRQENEPSAASMQLMPSDIAEDSGSIPKVVTTAPDALTLGTYTADNALHSIMLHGYTMDSEGNWVEDTAWTSGIYDPEKPLNDSGSLTLSRQPDGSLSISIMNGLTDDGATAATLFLPNDALDGTENIGILTTVSDITYDTAIPLLIRSISEDVKAEPYTAEDFADPSRFEGDLFTEAYTVTFSDVMPEEGSPAA